MKLEIRELTESDERAFMNGLKDWEGEDPHLYSFIWSNEITYPEMLTRLEKDRKGEELPAGRVPHTMLYGFCNGEIVGRVSIRHTLNEYLFRRSGHIGYAVAPRFRGKGYAKQLTEAGLQYCKGLGIPRVLLTCSDTNVPSWKVIEHFNGKLEAKVEDAENGELIRRYWIEI